MRLFHLLFLIILTDFLYGQHVKIEVKDSKTGDPIQNVSVIVLSTSYDTISSFLSNGRGLIFIKKRIPLKHDTIIHSARLNEIRFLHFSHPIYQNFKKEIFGLLMDKKEDTILVSVFLQPIRQRELREVRLIAPGKVDTVFGSDKLSVLDFEILNDGKLLLLLYPRSRERANELLYTENDKLLAQYTSQFPIQRLARDYRGNIHAIGDQLVHGIQCKEGKINTAQVPINYYIKYLAPIVDTTISKTYISNFNDVYPAFEYYAMDKKDSTYSLITNVKDDLMMTLYRSEYKWVDVRTKLWAKEKELETGIDAEIWVGANYFTQSIYWEDVYAPLFERNDSVFVVNYPRDLLEVFDANGKKLDEVPIYHHYQRSKTGFRRKLIQDYKTGEIYAVFEKLGFSYLGLLNVKTGGISEKVKLNFKYIEQIKVFNNEVFYTYRPFESTQKRYLYKERLPYNFGSAKLNQGTEMSIDTGK